MNTDNFLRISIMPFLASLACGASVLFLMDSGNLVFLFLVSLAVMVTLSTKVNTTVANASHVFALLLLPQLMVGLFVVFKGEIGALIDLASRIYTYGFENLFWGVSRMSRRLAEDGYFERSREVRAFALMGLLGASIIAYRYFVVMVTIGDTYKNVKRPARADEGWLSRNSAGLIMFLIFSSGAVFLDIYNPSCTSRCSYIQRSDFPGMFVLTALYSISYIAAGLWINSALIRKAKLKAQQGEQRVARTTITTVDE